MNPIKTSDLFQDTGDLKRLLDQLEAVQEKLAALRKEEIANARKLESELGKLNATTADQRDRIEETSAQTEELNKRFRKYTESLNENAVKIAAVKEAQRQLNAVNKLEAKLLTEKEGSYNALSAQYSLLKLRINQLSKEERENTAEGKKLVKQSREIYEEMKRLQEETGKTTLNVGNYKSALEGLPGPLARAKEGAGELFDAFKALLRNPLALAITAIVGAIATLGRSFLKTENGARLLAKAGGFLQGILATLTGIANDVGNVLIKAFNDPKEALQDLGNFIRDQFINRINGAIETVQNLGRAIGRWITGNGEGAREALADAGDAALQFATGLDEVQRAGIAEQLRKEREEAEANVRAFTQLAEAKFDIARANQALLQQAAQLETQQEIAQQQADDTTLSFRAQQEAAERAAEAGQRRLEIELRAAQNSLSLITREINLRRSLGEDVLSLLEQQTGAIQAVQQAETQLTVFLADNARQRREIRRDEFERELDFAVDFYDAQKTQLEKQIEDEDNLSVSARAARLGRLLELDKSAFAEQIRLIEDFTGQRLNLNELALEDDERIVRERLRAYELDDVTLGRILEVLRDRKAATQDILEVERDLQALRRATVSQVQTLPEQEAAKTVFGELSDVQRTVRRIAGRAEQERGEGLFGLFGLNVDDQEKQALQDAFGFAIDQVNQLAQARVEAANKAVSASDREVQAAQQALDNTIRLAQQGYAVNVQAAQQELDLAQERQEKALEQQEKAQREQRRLETLQQASSLVTASAKIFAEVPFPASLFAVGTMLGAFAFAKIRARRATREFREGGFDVLEGPSHERGGVYLGTGKDGVDNYAEGGEGRAIFSRKAMSRYGGIIPQIVESVNSLRLGKLLSPDALRAGVVVNAAGVDTSKMEDHLQAMRENGEKQVYFDGHGRRVEVFRNTTTIYL